MQESDKVYWVGKRVRVFKADAEGFPTQEILAEGEVVDCSEFGDLAVKVDDKFAEAVESILEEGFRNSFADDKLLSAFTDDVEELGV